MTDLDEQQPTLIWYNQLHQLDARLRATKIAHSPDCWLNAHDLLLKRMQEGWQPRNHQELADWLAPLFCRNAQEQVLFRKELVAWWQSIDPEQNATQITDEQPPKEREIIPTPHWWPFMLVAVLIVLATAYGVREFNRWLSAPPVVESPVKEPTEGILPPKVAQKTLLPITPLPARMPPEPITLSEKYRTKAQTDRNIIAWLLLSFAVIATASAIWRKRRRQVALKRRRDDPNNPLKALRLHDKQDALFDGPEVREALKRLHQPCYHLSRRLHEQRTVDHSVCNAGLFTPRYREQARVPEILLWVDVQQNADPVAGLAQTLVHRLRQSGLIVNLVRSYGTPERLYDEGRQRWTNLPELAGRYLDARLLLVGESRLLLDEWSGKPYPWVDDLAHWPQRLLLMPQAEPRQRLAPLGETGLLLAPFNTQGILSITQLLTSRQVTMPPQRMLPTLLSEEACRRFRITPSEQQIKALSGVLQRYLGRDGQQLLAAMAVYPQIHWGLMRALDFALWRDENPERREERLLRLASLPWVRSGWLPEWLRLRLIEAQSVKQQARLADIYRYLFSSLAIQGQEAIELPLRLARNRTLTRWVIDLLNVAPKSSVTHDQIFASLMHGGLRRKLAFVLPKAAARHLLRNGLTGGWLGIASGLLVVIMVLVVLFNWQAQERALKMQAAAFATIPISIKTTPETTALAAALAAQLGAHGFETLSPDSFDVQPIAPQQPATVPQTYFPNAEISASPALAGEAYFIKQRLAYIAYQLPVSVKSKDVATAGINIVLSNQGVPAAEAVFRDALGQSFDKTRWQQKVAETRTEAEEAATVTTMKKAAGKQPSSEPGAQSALKTCFIKPEMVELAGGTFKMGCVSGVECREDEFPVHEVTIKPFAMGKNEVTFDEYDRFAEATGRDKPSDNDWGRGRRPVINVSWNDVTAYAQWLSQQSGQTYRLPTESEWEYAARASTITPFSMGDCIHTDQTNYNGNFGFNNCGANTGVYREQTVPVNERDAENHWGLRYMHGNVREWTQDCWHDNYAEAPNDGSAWQDGATDDCARRVVRGGGWNDKSENLRSAYRYRYWSVEAFNFQGFRLASAPIPIVGAERFTSCSDVQVGVHRECSCATKGGSSPKPG